MRLRESRRAAAELDEIFQYGVENYGVVAAIAYVEEIEKRYALLLAHPRSGRAEPELGPDARSISSGSHRIYYEIDGDLLVILSILHMSRDVKRWLG